MSQASLRTAAALRLLCGGCSWTTCHVRNSRYSGFSKHRLHPETSCSAPHRASDKAAPSLYRPLCFVYQAHNALILSLTSRLRYWRLHPKAAFIFRESVYWHDTKAFGKNAQPAPEWCSSERVWEFPNKHFASQNCLCAHKGPACGNYASLQSKTFNFKLF